MSEQITNAVVALLALNGEIVHGVKLKFPGGIHGDVDHNGNVRFYNGDCEEVDAVELSINQSE